MEGSKVGRNFWKMMHDAQGCLDQIDQTDSMSIQALQLQKESVKQRVVVRRNERDFLINTAKYHDM